MAEDLDLEYLAELESDAKEEIDAHHEWLIENPDEQDGGAEEIPVHPDVLLSLIAAARSAVSAERPGREDIFHTVKRAIQNEVAAGDYGKLLGVHQAATVAADDILALFTYPAPVKADMLAWLAGQKRLELDYGFDSDYEDMFWRVHERTGNVNDREWDLIGQGATPFAALLSAKSFLESTTGKEESFTDFAIREGLLPEDAADDA